jgi:hypothetical protein
MEYWSDGVVARRQATRDSDVSEGFGFSNAAFCHFDSFGSAQDKLREKSFSRPANHLC